MKRVQVGLLVAGLLTLAAPVMAAGSGDPPAAARGRAGRAVRAADQGRREPGLGLSAGQRAEIREKGFAAAHRAVELRAKLADARLTLRELMTADKLDPSAIQEQARAVGEAQARLTENRIVARAAVLGVMTPEQRRAAVREFGFMRRRGTDGMEEMGGMRGMHGMRGGAGMRRPGWGPGPQGPGARGPAGPPDDPDAPEMPE